MLTLNKTLMDFIDSSPSSFHAVHSMKLLLDEAKFTALDEKKSWSLTTGNDYYVMRNNSSIIAFRYIDNYQGIKMVGAHTDSPCLKVKPNPDVYNYGCLQLQTEVYGSPLLNTWFDRDLGIAGKVYYTDKEYKTSTALINIKDTAIIPSLAIHLDPTANNNRSINPQTDILPILATYNKEDNNKNSIINIIVTELKQQGIDDIQEILDFELSLYDSNEANIIGINQDFIASARLDNLASCFLGIQALLTCETNNNYMPLLICNDHEEVGSMSAIGAQGSFLQNTLQRICTSNINLAVTMANSMLVSTDNAHGIHPNYPTKHDANHAPILNNGVVIKVNNNQSYATNAETTAIFKNICSATNSKYQTFTSRCDMRCGTTIGPLTSSILGVKTIDVGIPTFAMHSIRELAGVADTTSMLNILKYFFSHAEI